MVFQRGAVATLQRVAVVLVRKKQKSPKKKNRNIVKFGGPSAKTKPKGRKTKLLRGERRVSKNWTKLAKIGL